MSSTIAEFLADMDEMHQRNKGVFGDEAKEEMYNRIMSLEQWERNLLALYAQLGSVRKVSKALCIVERSVGVEIKRIKKIVRDGE